MDNQRHGTSGFLERKGVKIIATCIAPLRITPMDGINNQFTQPTIEEALNIYIYIYIYNNNNTNTKYSTQHNPEQSKVVAQ